MPLGKDSARSSAKALLTNAVSRLTAAGVELPILESEILLSRACGVSRVDLLAHLEAEPDDESLARFEAWLERRCKHEPLAYIVGEREFYGLAFEVSPAVLIPRPETETLVEVVISELTNITKPLIADIGVGCGAIAVSLAKQMPTSIVYAVDCSREALEVAHRNVQHHGLAERIHLLCGNIFEPLPNLRFDAIVSNPPYIPTSDIGKLPPEIAEYEPRLALDGGVDGLDCIRKLASGAPTYLRKNGLFAVEVGAGQADTVIGILHNNHFEHIRAERDYGGVERVVIGRLSR